MLTLILGLTVFISVYVYIYKNINERFTETNVFSEGVESSNKAIEIVISRYNEDLEWLKNEPFTKHPIIIYNKSDNENFHKPENMKKYEKLPNIGRTSHTIFHHIIHNYNNLADVTVFLHGSSDISYKYPKAVKMTNLVETHKDSVFIADKLNDIKTDLYDFQIDQYSSSNHQNFSINPENELVLSEIRPFGKWYEKMFGNKHTQHLAYQDMISVSKRHIQQHPIEYYKKLLAQTTTGSNTETGHYFERAWEAVFYPMDNLMTHKIE
jgi:hypothetical protein